MKKITLLAIALILIFGFFFGEQILKFVAEKLPSESFIKSKISELYDQKIRKPALNAINSKIDSIVEKTAESLATEAKSVVGKIIAPPPLRRDTEENSSVLTKSGVFTWTNVERIQVSQLPVLKPSYLLDKVAEARLNDMFKNQYFEHNSPTGESASTEAKKISYEYVLIGENIALGNFEGDQKLVEAWMNSPGHRANILNSKYTELGVAVGRGLFDERNQWIGVQIFAKPKSDCPVINESLKISIETNRIAISSLELKAEEIKKELEGSDPKTKEEVAVYNAKVSEYNSLADQINKLIQETKALISEHNSQASQFNLCAQS
ncbi:MAG: SCP-like extracellular [Parcubacteria group bacterium Gr01-1014_20]|nr:MAG: SCP-like extracellular [Parcubacteria group bacterium Gr01-1014_20]